MNTVQAVFDLAVHLMDAQNEATGATDTIAAREYRHRTPSLLNSLLDRVYLSSATCPVDTVGRPICPKVSAMEDVLALDERICTGVLPYGLAGLLLAEEDPQRANFFWQTFLEQLHEAGQSLCGEDSPVVDVYGFEKDWGTIGLGKFADW